MYYSGLRWLVGTVYGDVVLGLKPATGVQHSLSSAPTPSLEFMKSSLAPDSTHVLVRPCRLDGRNNKTHFGASRAAVFNSWITTSLGWMTLSQGLPETIRKHRYLPYDSQQYRNDSYKVAVEIILWLRLQSPRHVLEGHSTRKVQNHWLSAL